LHIRCRQEVARLALSQLNVLCGIKEDASIYPHESYLSLGSCLSSQSEHTPWMRDYRVFFQVLCVDSLATAVDQVIFIIAPQCESNEIRAACRVAYKIFVWNLAASTPIGVAIWTSPELVVGSEPGPVSCTLKHPLPLEPSRAYAACVVCISGSCSLGLAPSASASGAFWSTGTFASDDRTFTGRLEPLLKVSLAHNLVLRKRLKDDTVPHAAPCNLAKSTLACTGTFSLSFEDRDAFTIQYCWLLLRAVGSSSNAGDDFSSLAEPGHGIGPLLSHLFRSSASMRSLISPTICPKFSCRNNGSSGLIRRSNRGRI